MNENINNIIINSNNIDVNNEELNDIPNKDITNSIKQEKDITKKDSSNPNIPILDRLDSKSTNDDKNDGTLQKSNKENELVKRLLNRSITTLNQDDKFYENSPIQFTPSYIKNNPIKLNKRKKYNSKTILSFIFLQSFIIFATAISVILTIEKMLGIRIIMKFVDTFLEDEHLIKEESSPS